MKPRSLRPLLSIALLLFVALLSLPPVILGQQSSTQSSPSLPDLRKTADLGNADAQYRLGLMYDKGLGVPQDYAEAAKWYRKAAKRISRTSEVRQVGSAISESFPCLRSVG